MPRHPLLDLPDGDPRTVIVGNQNGRLAIDHYATDMDEVPDRENGCPVSEQHPN